MIDQDIAKIRDIKIKDVVNIRAKHEIYQECMRSIQESSVVT